MNKKILKIGIMIVVLLLSYYFISQNSAEFKNILNISPGFFSLLSILFLFSLILNGLLFKNILQLFNINLKAVEWFGLTAINSFSNYLFIKGGPVVRSLYLKRNYNFSFKNFLLIFIFISFIQIISVSTIALFFCFIHYLKNGTYNLYLLFFLSSTIILSSLFLILNKKITSKIKPSSSFNIFNLLKSKPVLLLNFIILACGSTMLQSIRIYLIYNELFEPITFAPTVIISATGLLSSYAAITPAAIGIKEFFMSSAAELSGANFTTTTAVASLDRIISIVWIFFLGIIFSTYFSKKKYEKNI